MILLYCIKLWLYCSFQYDWIIPLNNPTPLTQYSTRHIFHPYSNTCICQLLWILIIELFMLICIVTSACAYLSTHRIVEIVMQSAGAQHVFQSTQPLFHWWSYLCFQPCPIIDIAIPWWMGLAHDKKCSRPRTKRLAGSQDRRSKPDVWLTRV